MKHRIASLSFLAICVALICQWDIFTCANAQDKSTPQVRYGVGLGRLLTNEVERAKIDDLRFHIAKQNQPAEKPEEGPALLHIDGVTQRPDRPLDQKYTIWLNGRPYSESELPQGLSLVRNSKGEILGLESIVSKSKKEFAKIGDDITRPQTKEEARIAEVASQAAQKASLTGTTGSSP